MYSGVAFPGTVPKLASEAAAQLAKSFNVGAMKLPSKPVYRTGSARTTRGFHDTLTEKSQLLNSNNSSNTEGVDSAAMEVIATTLTPQQPVGEPKNSQKEELEDGG